MTDINTNTIALLVLATSKNRDNWLTVKDSYLFKLTLKSFLLTMDRENKYLFYIGIDSDDRIFSKIENQEEITRFSRVFKNVEFIFYTIKDVAKGHVTKMWNQLFKDAYDKDCDYFYQCGDDMEFKTNGWINSCIEKLKQNNDIGLAGPINNNNRILTQAFVSRKHMKIFGWFFPEQIINWCCDDWYNMVYHPKYLYPLNNHLAVNLGGQPRYDIHNIKNFDKQTPQQFSQNVNRMRSQTHQLAQKHKLLIEQYVKENN